MLSLSKEEGSLTLPRCVWRGDTLFLVACLEPANIVSEGVFDRPLLLEAQARQPGGIHVPVLLVSRALAVAELESVRGRERGGFVFPARTGEPYRPIGRHSLARTVARMCERLDMEKWTPHDLRRTARTGFGEAVSADPVVAEKIVGHALPALLRVYDQGQQWEARVDVLERWGQWVSETVDGAE